MFNPFYWYSEKKANERARFKAEKAEDIERNKTWQPVYTHSCGYSRIDESIALCPKCGSDINGWRLQRRLVSKFRTEPQGRFGWRPYADVVLSEPEDIPTDQESR